MSNPQNPQNTNLQTDNSIELNSKLGSETSNVAQSLDNAVEITPTNSSISSLDTNGKNNKTPLVVAGIIGGLILVAVVASIGLSNSPKESKSAQNSMSKSVKNEEKNSQSSSDKSEQNSQNKSSENKSDSQNSTENKTSQINQSSDNLVSDSKNSTLSANSTANSTTNNINTANNSQNSIQPNSQTNSQKPNQNSTQEVNSEKKVENKVENKNEQNQSNPKPANESQLKISEESKAVDKFFEVKATNEKLNLNPQTMTKEDAKILKGDESKVAIPAAAGKKYRVTLSYANSGDKDFEQATLTVNVDKALKILPGTVKDTFEGKSVTVSDSLFKENQMKYGPGTQDKDTAGVKVGQRGEMTINVEVPAGTAPGDYRIATTLENPNGGKGGIPGIFFLTVQ